MNDRGIRMKLCPNCKMELPDEAHFCPRCMFQYEKKEIEIKTDNKRWRNIGLSVMVGVFTICVCIGISSAIKSVVKNDKKNETLDIQNVMDENFRTGEKIDYYSEIENDLRDVLGKSFDDCKEMFGEETAEKYNEDGFDIHTFGIVTVTVNDGGMIQDISIDYTAGENEEKYGIYGIDNKFDRKAVEAVLGMPNQQYGEELHYLFDKEFNPSLIIHLSPAGMVEQLEYYYIE